MNSTGPRPGQVRQRSYTEHIGKRLPPHARQTWGSGKRKPTEAGNRRASGLRVILALRCRYLRNDPRTHTPYIHRLSMLPLRPLSPFTHFALCLAFLFLPCAPYLQGNKKNIEEKRCRLLALSSDCPLRLFAPSRTGLLGVPAEEEGGADGGG